MTSKRRLLPAACAVLLTGAAFFTAPVPAVEAAWVSRGLEVSMTKLELLYPGRTQQMWVNVRNPYQFAVRITRLEASVTRSSSRSCKPRPGNVTLSAPHASLPKRVGAQTRTSVGWFEVRMPAGADSACAGSRFVITVTAWAAKDRK